MDLRKLTPDGWAAFALADDADDPVLLVRLREQPDGQLVVCDLLLSARSARLSADLLRAVSISRVESIMNTDTIRRYMDFDDLMSSAEAAAVTARLDKLHDAGRRRARRPRPTADLTLPRPDGRDVDGFYARVADVYTEAATRTSKPAVLIAETNDVPVNTVRRWVAEARRRRALSPGRRGA